MEKHTKQLVGLGVLVVGGYILYNYWKNNSAAPATTAKMAGMAGAGTTATPTASMAGMVGATGSKSLAGFKGLTGFKSLNGFEKGFAGENTEVKDASWHKAEGNVSLPAGKFFDTHDGFGY